MFLLGFVVFFLPFFMYVFFLRKLRLGRGFCVFFTSLAGLFFLTCFFCVKDRSFDDLVNHILYPTIQFYVQYYAVLGVSFICFPLMYHFINQFRKIKVLQVLSCLFGMLSIFLATSLVWAKERFPLTQPRTVFFVLSSPVEGGVQVGQLLSAFAVILVPLISFFLFFSVVSRMRRFKDAAVLWKCTFMTMGTCVVCVIASFCMTTRIWEYPKLISEFSSPATFSDFYAKEFRKMNFEDLEFPKEQRNVIVIFLESMESSFADKAAGGMMDSNLIPNLTKLANENISFSHSLKGIGGGHDLEGTGWTIAGLVSKFGGAPFNPIYMDANPSGLNFFLPNLVTLTDILRRQGYDQRFIFGSDKKFASRGAFFAEHGKVEVHDINWYKSQGLLPEDYQVFWDLRMQSCMTLQRWNWRNLLPQSHRFFSVCSL